MIEKLRLALAVPLYLIALVAVVPALCAWCLADLISGGDDA